MVKPFTWSYSTLTAFEQCPKQYAEEKLWKTSGQTTSDILEYGKFAHKAFENYVKKGDALPLDLIHHQGFLSGIRDMDGRGTCEQRICLTEGFAATGFFDSDAWCRAVLDYVLIHPSGRSAMVIDYKFGKQKFLRGTDGQLLKTEDGKLIDDFEQIELACAMLSTMIPTLEKFIGLFYWAKEKKRTKKVMFKEDMMDIWGKFMPRVRKMEAAYKKQQFIPKPSGICRSYCSVKACPHNGVSNEGKNRDRSGRRDQRAQ